eukprot:TRINITY_DN23970_c0_g2_i2.p1 TRINITY_DN23970_c0_g2~~TRINITY_DN23970_c0_g2_i2.p1  ORF type:complete len:427 (-),score=45.44 TRINITY_DN23970_c0_g2_i2:333-1613(-)
MDDHGGVLNNARCAPVANMVAEKLSKEHGAALLEVNSTVQHLASRPYQRFRQIADRAYRAMQPHLPTSVAKWLDLGSFQGAWDGIQGFGWTWWNYKYSFPASLVAMGSLVEKFSTWVSIITYFATVIVNVAFSGFNLYMCPKISTWMETLDEGNSTVSAEEGFRKGHAGVEQCALRDHNSIRSQVLDQIKVARVIMALKGLPESNLPEVHASPVDDRVALIKERELTMQYLMKQLNEKIICSNSTLLDSIIDYPWQDVVSSDSDLPEVLPGIVACMCINKEGARQSSNHADLCEVLQMKQRNLLVGKDLDLNSSNEIHLETDCSDAASRTDVNEHVEQEWRSEQHSDSGAEPLRLEYDSLETEPSKVKDGSVEREPSEVEEDFSDGKGRELEKLRKLALENDITSMDEVKAQPPNKIELESEGSCL